MIEVGQVWTLLIEKKKFVTMRFTVERVYKARAYGKLSDGTAYSVSTRVLIRRMRNAKLVGEPSRRKYHMGWLDRDPPRPEMRVFVPRGIVKNTGKHADALALQRKGMTVKQIAEHMTTSVGNVSAWLTKAREAEEDARRLGQ